MDGGHRRHGGVRDRDDLVARSDAAGGEREVKRLGAAPDADAWLAPTASANSFSKASVSAARM
jgi:hypothetical protein